MVFLLLKEEIKKQTSRNKIQKREKNPNKPSALLCISENKGCVPLLPFIALLSVKNQLRRGKLPIKGVICGRKEAACFQAEEVEVK